MSRVVERGTRTRATSALCGTDQNKTGHGQQRFDDTPPGTRTPNLLIKSQLL